MAYHSDTLASMTGQVIMQRPGVNSLLVNTWINSRIRQVIDARPFWSDLIAPGIMSIPDAYTTGTISVTQGSPIVTGTGTAWPVNNVVNTTLPDGVGEIGYADCTPASMTGITASTMLYVDPTGANPETVAVVEVSPTTFNARFQYFHNAGCAIYSSSIAGRQFRVGNNWPVFTIRSVQSATSLTLDNAWGGAALSLYQYMILRMLFVLAPDLKHIIDGSVVDSQYGGIPIVLHRPVAELNWRDPQRTAVGVSPPQLLADWGPNENGNMLYELWPAQTGARQLSFLYAKQWPELRLPTDRPPWFIRPDIFVHGALADALRFKVDRNDAFQNVSLANDYEMRFRAELEEAKNADESKAQTAFRWDHTKLFPGGGGNWLVSNDLDLFTGNF